MSEGIDANKTIDSHKCIICNYYYFLKVSFRFQKQKKGKRSDCYDLMQKTMSFNNVTIVFLKELIIEYILVI